MKLLTKSQIVVSNSQIKKSQIEEGVRIAKKIDLLREELLSLQKQRLDFIEGTKNEIVKRTEKEQRELEKVLKEKQKLESTILIYKDKISNLLKTLDAISHRSK